MDRTNLIYNGDFSLGTDSWNGSDLSVSNGELTVKGNAPDTFSQTIAECNQSAEEAVKTHADEIIRTKEAYVKGQKRIMDFFKMLLFLYGFSCLHINCIFIK